MTRKSKPGWFNWPLCPDMLTPTGARSIVHSDLWGLEFYLAPLKVKYLCQFITFSWEWYLILSKATFRSCSPIMIAFLVVLCSLSSSWSNWESCFCQGTVRWHDWQNLGWEIERLPVNSSTNLKWIVRHCHGGCHCVWFLSLRWPGQADDIYAKYRHPEESTVELCS